MNTLFLDSQLVALGLVSLLNLSLGIFVFCKNYKSRLNRIFLFLALAISAWCLATFFNTLFYNNLPLFDFFERTTFISGMLIALLFYLFASNYPYEEVRNKRWFIWVYSLLIFVATIITFFTDLFVEYTDSIEGVTTTHHNGLVYIVYSIVLVVPFLLGLINLYKKMKKSDGVYRSHFITLLLLVGASIILSFYFDVFLVGLELYRYNAIGPYFSLLFIFAIMRMIISKDK